MKIKSLFLLTLISLIILSSCGADNNIFEIAEESQIFVDGTYIVDLEASSLYWEAYKSIGGHMGSISLNKGEILVKDGQPSSGSFSIDMQSITNTDIENDAMRINFLNHLKSDDFFSVADYQTARFDITRIEPYKGDGNYNYQIEGDLIIRSITKPVTVLAKITMAENQLMAHGMVMVDRTEFDITIRSGSIFEELGDRLIKDEFLLEMDLVGKLQKSL